MSGKHKIIILFIVVSSKVLAAPKRDFIYGDSTKVQTIRENFNKAYDEISSMLDGKQALSFKRAVFLVENAYLFDSLDYSYYLKVINGYKRIVLEYHKANRLKDYNFQDSAKNSLSASLFKLFTDTIYDRNKNIVSLPFRYDFKDVFGDRDYYNTFVTKLVLTNKGNCHSLPYLYKIISEEIGTQAYLALAPMHIYLKERNKKVGWYNVELTSGQYPIDAYLVATGFINRDNIMTGLYMDTLSNKESVATCLMDLCYAYKHRLDSFADPDFQLKCASKALTIKPNYVTALLRKNQIHSELSGHYLKLNDKQNYELHHSELIATRKMLIKMGYQDIPEDTFNKWFVAYQKNKSKYINREINKY